MYQLIHDSMLLRVDLKLYSTVYIGHSDNAGAIYFWAKLHYNQHITISNSLCIV